VVERPWIGGRCFTTYFTRGLYWEWLTWDWTGPLGGKRRTISWKGQEVWCGKLAHPTLSPPFVSVKNRWIDSHKKVLNILITCLSYDSDKPSSHLSTEGWVCPHCFNGWWLRERLLCVDRVRYVWLTVTHVLSVGSVWHVGQVSPAGCTSIRIIATVGYE
jgi:hypothetical protein